MACPKCKCEETYWLSVDDTEEHYAMERCASCGTVFYLMDAEEDDETER